MIGMAGVVLSGHATAEATDCTAFLIGSWQGEHTEQGVLDIHLSVTYGKDGSFSAERAELHGTSSASYDAPAGTWEAGPGATAGICQITFTNGRSGETTTEWAEMLGKDAYGTGHDSTALVMHRQAP